MFNLNLLHINTFFVDYQLRTFLKERDKRKDGWTILKLTNKKLICYKIIIEVPDYQKSMLVLEANWNLAFPWFFFPVLQLIVIISFIFFTNSHGFNSTTDRFMFGGYIGLKMFTQQTSRRGPLTSCPRSRGLYLVPA